MKEVKSAKEARCNELGELRIRGRTVAMTRPAVTRKNALHLLGWGIQHDEED